MQEISEEQLNLLKALGITHRTGTDIRKMKTNKPAFVVDGYLPRQVVTALSGEGGVGKGFLTLLMAVCVANGIPFFGKAVEQGTVLIWDAENRPEYDIKPRLDGICGQLQKEGLDVSTDNIIIPEFNRILPLSSPEGIRALQLHCEIYRPTLIIIDSLTDYVRGDMKSSELMVEIVNNINCVLHKYDNAMLIIHHWNKGGLGYDYGDRLRGASGFRDAIRSHIAVDKKRGTLVLCHEKANCGGLQEKLYVNIEFLEDGLIKLTGTSSKTEEPKKPKATDTARKALMEYLSGKQTVKTGDVESWAKAKGYCWATLKSVYKTLRDEGLAIQKHGIWGLSK